MYSVARMMGKNIHVILIKKGKRVARAAEAVGVTASTRRMVIRAAVVSFALAPLPAAASDAEA